MPAQVISVSAAPTHEFSKCVARHITLLAGLGVEGDAHCGVTVQHRSRVARDPTQPNLRQVHLIHAELFDELMAKGFELSPGQLGENIMTRGIDLLALPVDTELHLGSTAVVRLTGLRNPCVQIDRFRAGLMSAVLDRAPDGSVVRKSGVMGVVVASGPVRAGDGIAFVLPEGRHRQMERV